MKLKKLSEKKWFTGAVIACIGVAFYVLLTNLGTVLSAIGAFIGNFRAIIIGVVFAYIINPLAKLFYYRLFRKMNVGNARWVISVALAFLTLLLVLTLLLGMLIPQLLQSVQLFTDRFETYASTLRDWVDDSPLKYIIDMQRLDLMSENAIESISSFLKNNASRILGAAANSGRHLLSTVISLILAVYLLIDKKQVLARVRQLIRVILKPESSESLLDFLLRCDTILVNFISQSLLDSLIIGSINAVFMLIFRMQYVGLVSFVVAVLNLIPNFGAAIGIVIGSFLLLLVNPIHALIFVLFGIVLQLSDAYILKPKLFSNSLGVSGLLILAASIVLGNLFGLLGVLLAIPVAAILSFVYSDYFLPRQQARFKQQYKKTISDDIR